jgi:GxxExxY protein
MKEPQGHRDTEFEDQRSLTASIIAAGIEVHRQMGPGLLEPIYDAAMSIEFDERGIKYVHQPKVPAYYKGRLLGEYRVDFLVEDAVIVEIKSVTTLLPVFDAQLLTYLRVMQKRIGLLMNFNSRLLRDGVRRFVL